MKQTVLLEVNDVRCLGTRTIAQETLGDVIAQKIISVSTNQTRHILVADLGDKNIVKWARDGRIQILLQANFVLIQSQR